MLEEEKKTTYEFFKLKKSNCIYICPIILFTLVDNKLYYLTIPS